MEIQIDGHISQAAYARLMGLSRRQTIRIWAVILVILVPTLLGAGYIGLLAGHLIRFLIVVLVVGFVFQFSWTLFSLRGAHGGRVVGVVNADGVEVISKAFHVKMRWADYRSWHPEGPEFVHLLSVTGRDYFMCRSLFVTDADWKRYLEVLANRVPQRCVLSRRREKDVS